MFKPSAGDPDEVVLLLSAVPDQTGRFSVEDTLYKSVYGEGDFILKADYADGTHKTSIPFSIIDPNKINDDFEITINKEVFGFGEEVIVDGIIPGLAQGSGVTIVLVKPDGDLDEFGRLVENSIFNWTWTTPISEQTQRTEKADGRIIEKTNLGIYQLIISTASGTTNLFFKLSSNPETDSINLSPLEISTDKPIYAAGETLRVFGTAQKRDQGHEGLVVPDRVHISVETTDFPTKRIFDSFVYFDSGGNFESSFVMPIGVFIEGTYKVKAEYLTHRTDTLFSVTNDFSLGGEQELGLLVSLDKEEYSPGETVQITGRPTKLVHFDFVDITVVQEDDLAFTCGSFVCGSPGETVTVFPTASGSFSSEFDIPNNSDSLGKYEVMIDSEFDALSVSFEVLEKIIEEPTPVTAPRITEKFNRIPDSQIPIILTEKPNGDETLKPRVIQGSLLTSVRGDEPNVNLKVLAPNGLCVIGPDAECSVKESTRAPGAIYSVVEIDGINYNVRYSGPDAKLEKFTILPQSSDATLAEATWNVEILKEDQVSRFYYKVTHISE